VLFVLVQAADPNVIAEQFRGSPWWHAQLTENA
jgi:hypothetical protein